MSAILLSTILLVSPASPLLTAQPPSLVEPESGAWAVVHAGQLWVCWSPGPDCFERVVFDDDGSSRDEDFEAEDGAEEQLSDLEPLQRSIELGTEDWRLGFWGPRSLWIEHDEQRWRVVQGQRYARTVEDPPPIRLTRIGLATCGPDAMVPALIGGRLSFREAPRCAVELAATSCVTRPTPEWEGQVAPRVRKPTPIRLRAGIEITNARAWTAGASERRLSSGFEIHVVVELGFDWHRHLADRRAAALLSRRGRAQLRELPTVTPGPLAARETEALAAIVCEGGQP